MSKLKLTLYIGSTCHFCARVTDFLKQHPMDIQVKDVWQDQEANKEMLELTHGVSQVPCLRIDDTFMFESLDIIEKLKTL